MGGWACRSPSQPRPVPVDVALRAPQDVSFTSCVLRTGGATLFLGGDGRIVLGTPVRLHPPPITRKAAVDRRFRFFRPHSLLSHITFSLNTARTWALFSFPGRYRARTLIRFTEDRAQLRRALPADALRHNWRWDFGDGTHAPGWAVTHRYAHAGLYRITVQAYYSTLHRYFPFDKVRISITR